MITVVGDLHGNIRQMYRDVALYSPDTSLIIQVGDFGIWPDHDRIDKQTARHGGAGDFRELLETGFEAPIPTVFIKGNHEDFEYLEGKEEILPGLHYLANGQTMLLTSPLGEPLMIGALGGCYSRTKYPDKSWILREPSRKRHFYQEEVESLGKIDLLVAHDFLTLRGKIHLESILEMTEARMVVCGHNHYYTTEASGYAKIVQLPKIEKQGAMAKVDWNRIFINLKSSDPMRKEVAVARVE